MYTVHVISQNIDFGADGGASAPVGPSVATPLPASFLFEERVSASTTKETTKCFKSFLGSLPGFDLLALYQ